MAGARCTAEAGCSDGLVCVRGACTTCARHEDCASKTCDLYRGSAGSYGRCVASQDVTTVTDAVGLQQKVMSGGTFKLSAGQYAIPVLNIPAGKTVTLFGEANGSSVSEIQGTIAWSAP